MDAQSPFPKTLIEAVVYFADEDKATEYAAGIRWPEGVTCPACGGTTVGYIKTRRKWQCKGCKKQFSVKTGTIMEDSPIPTGKWLVVMWLECNAKNSISSYEIHRSIGVTQKSAWFMLHRVRTAMNAGTLEKLAGTVEADETFVGGKAKNMHRAKRERLIKGRGAVGKAVVMGLLERHGGEDEASKVRAFVVRDTKKKTLQPVVEAHVEPGSAVYTDSLASYSGLSPKFVHDFIDHAERYVNGAVHTNGLENFWSLFKRCIKGTHVSVDPAHLFRYVDAEAFRFNNRKQSDGERFRLTLRGIMGKRLTYKELIGDNAVCPPEIQP